MKSINLVFLTGALAVAQSGLGRVEASNVLPTKIPANIRLCTDYAVAGVGGMRWKNDWTVGPMTAEIKDFTLSGNSTGTVTKAYLYWFVVAPGYDPTVYDRFDALSGSTDVFSTAEKVNYSKAMTFAGVPLVGSTEILELGPGYGNNWPGSYPSSESFAFRADVTALVASLDGSPVDLSIASYTLSGFAKSCEGASLVIFYRDTLPSGGNDTSNDRDLYLFEGNDSNSGMTYDAVGWDVSLSGFAYQIGSGEAKLQLHIGDAQSGKDDGELFLDGRLFLPFGSRWNGDTVPAAENYFPTGFDGTGRLWDIITFNRFESQLLQGGIPWMTAGESTDYWNLVLAIVDLPSAHTCVEIPVDSSNRVPKVNCQEPVAVEANIVTGLPAVRFSAKVSDPDGDKVTVIWSYAETSGGSTIVLASEVVTFAQANEEKVVFYTHPRLAPSATQQMVVSVTDGKPGHVAQSCSINVQTIEGKVPLVSTGLPIVVTGNEGTGGASLPNFQDYYLVQGYADDYLPIADRGTPYLVNTDPTAIVAWDNHSRTVQHLPLTQLPAVGTFYGVGVHPITVVVTDEALNSANAIKYFEVKRAPGNRAPVATNDLVFVGAGQTITIPVLANDFDVDADPFHLDYPVGTRIPTLLGGTATVNADGTFTYIAPNSSRKRTFGTDEFSYTIKDVPPSEYIDLAGTDTGTVSIRVSFINAPPVANGDQLTTNEDEAVSFALPFLTSNDTDADHDSLQVNTALFGLPSHGTLTASGVSWEYTPAFNYFGPDSFTYSIDDGHGGSATGRVLVTVNPVNDRPVALNDSGITHGEPITLSLVANDYDVDGGTLSLASLSYTGTGALVANGDGTITYTPAPGFVGVESARYTVSDGRGGVSYEANVTLRTIVNNAPDAFAGSNTTPTGTTVSGQLVATDPDGDVLNYSLASPTSANGVTVLISANGTYTYGPATSVGVDTFSYSVSDGLGGTSTAIITITVTAPPPAACDLYPITVHINTVKDLAAGATFDVFGGANPGNFGWLTWVGSPSVPTLVKSLTIPGNSGTYVDPYDANDREVSVGDWVQGSPGVQNSSEVRARLDILKTIDICVPVWDSVKASGNNTLYKVVDFARIRITGYALPSKNTITATFLGFNH